VPYDGSTYFNSGPLYAADAGRDHALTVTFTKAGSFPYLDVANSVLRMRGNVTVTP
jgi:plastocyanin